jgi:uncharacterized protein YjbI with pentapeptide repeats
VAQESWICKELDGRRIRGRSLAGTQLNVCRQLAGSELDSCDVSRATLDGLRWSRSKFVETDFSHASMRNLVDRANLYKDCRFIGSDLRGAIFGYEGTVFDGCDFSRAKFDRTLFIRPRFVDCTFDGTFREVDFEASSFARCKFSGRIEGGWFRNGYKHPALLARFGPPAINTMDLLTSETRFFGASLSRATWIDCHPAPRWRAQFF